MPYKFVKGGEALSDEITINFLHLYFLEHKMTFLEPKIFVSTVSDTNFSERSTNLDAAA